jgi:hypothetical protein
VLQDHLGNFYLDTKQRPTLWPTPTLLQVSVNTNAGGIISYEVNEEIQCGVFSDCIRSVSDQIFEDRCSDQVELRARLHFRERNFELKRQRMIRNFGCF